MTAVQLNPLPGTKPLVQSDRRTFVLYRVGGRIAASRSFTGNPPVVRFEHPTAGEVPYRFEVWGPDGLYAEGALNWRRLDPIRDGDALEIEVDWGAR